MDPLSVAASITGILTAAAQVSTLLSGVKDAPASISAVLTELEHIKIVFRALQRFLDRATTVTGPRAALIQLGDVVTILTQTVLVFSEMETLITPLSNPEKSPGWHRWIWAWQQSGVTRLLNQIQRHKTSLTLLLQIIQW